MIVPATPTSRRHSARTVLTLAWVALLALALAGLPAGSPSARAGTFVPPKKTVTYLITITVDSTMVAGTFSSTETVTGNVVANPMGSGPDPTAWEGEGTLDFGPIVNTGLPQGCELTTTAPTGTLHVAVVKAGENVTVNWSPNTTPITASIIMCPGMTAPAPYVGGASAEPFLLLEPKQFTVAAAGGTQALTGKFDAAGGMMENIGTMTVTRRETCGEKVKAVNTYPPGQATSASSMVGKAFGVGEKVTADTNTEFVFEDGSVMRLAKGASFKETPNCDATQDKSKDYKGTLLLGKIWFHVTSAFGGEYDYDACYSWGKWATKVKVPCERTVNGVRGTTYWVVPGKKTLTYTVSEGSIWVQAFSSTNRPASKKIIVKAGHTLVLSKKADPVLRKTKPSDAFPFGGPVG